MQTTTFRISEALRRIKEQSLSIPQFQRPFTWRESQVKLLADSLARNYPIGSILLLTKSPELALRSRGIEAVIREGYPPDEVLNRPSEATAEHFYVLDGQQRLTSMARVLLNAHPTKTYYFDLRALLDAYPKDEATWVAIRARGKNDPERKEHGRLLRSDVVLDSKKVEVYVSEYLEDSGDIPELASDKHRQREAAAQIKSVFETIRNYQIPVVILERDAQVESVCRVFETINSTGTRLTTFDLAVARFFPNPDLRRLWTETLERYPILTDFEVDGERLLQTISLLQAAKEGRYAEPTRSDLLSLPPDFIEASWELGAETLDQTYRWAKSQGAREKT
jgi:NADH:ubiquinone oxidoreductase subunit C